MEKSEIVSTAAVACKTDAKGEAMSGDSLFSDLYVEGLFTDSLDGTIARWLPYLSHH